MSQEATKGLTLRIFIGMGAGAALGVAVNLLGNEGLLRIYLTEGLFDIVGQIFVNSLQLLVVPLVFVSLVCGTAELNDLRELGRIGGKTVALYLLTTAIAISLALTTAVLLKPGAGLALTTHLDFAAAEAPSLKNVLINMFPSNPLRAMVEANMLQVIVFSLLTGFAITLAGESGKTVFHFFRCLNDVVLRLVVLLMLAAPFGVCALLAKVFAEQGFEAILPLGKYFSIVAAVLVLHGLVFYPVFLKLLSGLSPVTMLRKFHPAAVFAFSTASSSATLPITLDNVERRLGVHASVASFTIPLGATINMDGTAIMQGVATVFIAQAYGIPIGLGGYLMVVLTATLASVGTAGVPGVGLITLAMVLRQVNLPVEGIALIIGVDRLLDMLRTAVNVTGDAVVTCIVAKSENLLDRTVFDSKTALDPQPACTPS